MLWPLALWLVRTPTGRWRLIAGVILVAPVLRWFLAEFWGWPAAYALLPARMDGLAIGAGLALLQHTQGTEWFVRRRRALLTVATATGLAFLVTRKLFVWTHPLPIAVDLSLSVICYGALIAGTLGLRDTRAARVMSFGPVVYLGQISYGLYLIHRWLVDAVRQHSDNTLIVLLVTASGTAVLAMLSYHLIEKPINDQRHRFEAATSAPAEVAVPSARSDCDGPRSVFAFASTRPRRSPAAVRQ